MPTGRRPPREYDPNLTLFAVPGGGVIINRIPAFDQLDFVADDIRQLFFSLSVQFKTIFVRFPQNRVRGGKHLALGGLIFPSVAQFRIDVVNGLFYLGML